MAASIILSPGRDSFPVADNSVYPAIVCAGGFAQVPLFSSPGAC